MRVSLHAIKANHNELNIGRVQLLFSYNTLVAVTDQDGKRWQTASRYSNTTTRHIRESGYSAAEKITQAALESLASQVVTLRHEDAVADGSTTAWWLSLPVHQRATIIAAAHEESLHAGSPA